MRTDKDAGRLVGLLLMAQSIPGALVNFVLLGPVLTASPGYLVNAAANSLRVSTAVVIGLVAGALSVAVAVAAWPVFRRYTEAGALWFFAFSTVGLALTVIENNAVMSLLSLSQSYVNANGADEAIFQALRGVVAASRNWAHYTHMLIGGGTLLIFYGVLYRYTLVPRPLAAFGVAAVLLQMLAVSMPLFGEKVIMLMLVPLGIVHLTLAVWLLAKGFEGGAQGQAETYVADARA